MNKKANLELVENDDKKSVLALVSESVNNLLVTERIECERFMPGQIESLINDGVVTVDEMVAVFRETIENSK